MNRVSVTTLEKFRRYMNEVSSFDTELSLIESIKGIFTGNDKTKFGSAYHKLIEGDFKKHPSGLLVEADGLQFVIPQKVAAPALEYAKAHTLMFHEITSRKVYETSRYPIQVSARIDGLEGIFSRDVKTKFRSVDWMEYYDSCQWKFYLDMTDLRHFYYDLFEIKGFESLPGGKPCIIPDVEVIAHDPYHCERYPGMESELVTILEQFLEYLHSRGFEKYLKPAVDEPIFS